MNLIPTLSDHIKSLSARQLAFLACYRECGSITRAAELAETHRSNHSRWLKESSEYQIAYNEAQEAAVDLLESEAVRRATKGIKLTPKQKRFCQEYVIDLNGTQAAIRAGYSKKTAREIASQNLTKLDIQAEIQRLQSEIGHRLATSADAVVADLQTVAKLNPDDGITRAKYSDKLKALELLGRHLGIFNDRLEVKSEQREQVIVVRPEKYAEWEKLNPRK